MLSGICCELGSLGGWLGLGDGPGYRHARQDQALEAVGAINQFRLLGRFY